MHCMLQLSHKRTRGSWPYTCACACVWRVYIYKPDISRIDVYMCMINTIAAHLLWPNSVNTHCTRWSLHRCRLLRTHILCTVKHASRTVNTAMTMQKKKEKDTARNTHTTLGSERTWRRGCKTRRQAKSRARKYLTQLQNWMENHQKRRSFTPAEVPLLRGTFSNGHEEQ
jgi:hypothetical protein